MERLSDEQLLKIIEDIEKKLLKLKLEIELRKIEKNDNGEQGTIKVDDRVRILNPSKGQETEGTVDKVNEETGYVTILGRKLKKKIVRKKKNVQKIE